MTDRSTFVVAYDFSKHSEAALFAALDLAKRFEATIKLLHVLHTPPIAYPSAAGSLDLPPTALLEIREHAQEALAKVAAGIDSANGSVESHVVEGVSVNQAIVDFCEEQSAELLIMGTHGRTGMAHVFLGSVAERTLRHAPCPVLTVRAPEEA